MRFGVEVGVDSEYCVASVFCVLGAFAGVPESQRVDTSLKSIGSKGDAMSLFVRILLGSLFVLGISGCAPAGDSASEEAPAEEMAADGEHDMADMDHDMADMDHDMSDMGSAEAADVMPGEEMTEAEGDDGGDMAEEAPAEDAEAVEMIEIEEAAE